MDDPTVAFAALVQGPEAGVALDRGALLIAAHRAGRDTVSGFDIETEISRLDALAASVPAATVDALRHHLFDTLGFVGDVETYDDPANSFLDRVLDRRRGIPITLSVLMVEVGRRLGLQLHGVGMPGHFLVGADDEARWWDPFASGRELDADGARGRFVTTLGAEVPWSPSFLAPVGTHAVLARMLANLKQGYLRRRDPVSLAWVLRLRLLLPGADPREEAELAGVLAATGDYGAAAAALERLADNPSIAESDAVRQRARRLRARLN